MTGDDTGEDGDDEQWIELEALAAIFPELVILPTDGNQDVKRARLKIPVEPIVPLRISTPHITDVPNEAKGGESGAPLQQDEMPQEIHKLSHLPPLIVDILLPPGYPSIEPPVIHLSCEDAWLSSYTVRDMEKVAATLWEEIGKDQVLFTYIDHLQDEAEAAFGVQDILEVANDLKVVLLDFDLRAKRAKFEKGTYDCGVCLGTLKMRKAYTCSLLMAHRTQKRHRLPPPPIMFPRLLHRLPPGLL